MCIRRVYRYTVDRGKLQDAFSRPCVKTRATILYGIFEFDELPQLLSLKLKIITTVYVYSNTVKTVRRLPWKPSDAIRCLARQIRTWILGRRTPGIHGLRRRACGRSCNRVPIAKLEHQGRTGDRVPRKLVAISPVRNIWAESANYSLISFVHLNVLLRQSICTILINRQRHAQINQW